MRNRTIFAILTAASIIWATWAVESGADAYIQVLAIGSVPTVVSLGLIFCVIRTR